MNEATPCAERATEPESFTETRVSASVLVDLVKAMEHQTLHMAALTERLAELTETLVQLADRIETDDDDETEKFDTLS